MNLALQWVPAIALIIAEHEHTRGSVHFNACERTGEGVNAALALAKMLAIPRPRPYMVILDHWLPFSRPSGNRRALVCGGGGARRTCGRKPSQMQQQAVRKRAQK
jgi:hypothetical protein